MSPGQTGRPRLKGAGLPSLQQRLADPQTIWRPLTVRWYDGRRQVLDYATGTALWYHSGQPVVPLRWVLLRDPAGVRAPMALLCTDPQRAPHTMVVWFLRRWQVEVTFQAVRTHLGGETQRQWGSGRARPLPAPRPSCWASSAGSPWSPTSCCGAGP